MTMREVPKEAGLEPDECYVIGAEKEYPDLAIEVVWTSGGMSPSQRATCCLISLLKS